MPVIRFDVLIPAVQAADLEERFVDAGAKLARAGVCDELAVDTDHEPEAQSGVREQLEQTYRDEHDGRDLTDARLIRYRLAPRGFAGSLNQLAMALSRILTPAAALPMDPVLLENEAAYERPAYYPWWLEIER